MQQLEAQTKSFHAMTDRLSSNITADFEVMLQKQLSSSIEGYVLRYFCVTSFRRFGAYLFVQANRSLSSVRNSTGRAQSQNKTDRSSSRKLV